MTHNTFDESAKKAEAIVNEFGDALSADFNGFARPLSLLKNSKAEIEAAIKEYLVVLIKTGKLTKDHVKVLSYGYASLVLFTEDEKANRINTAAQQKENAPLPPDLFELYSDFAKESSLRMKERVVEITDFIKEQA